MLLYLLIAILVLCIFYQHIPVQHQQAQERQQRQQAQQDEQSDQAQQALQYEHVSQNDEGLGLNNVDAIVYINLDKRDDRKQEILSELQKFNFPEEKIHRISATYVERNGHKGCAHSHYRAMKLIREQGWKTVVVLEDDFKFKEPIQKVNGTFNKIYASDTPWNVILLAQANGSKTGKHKFMENITGATTASGYLVHSGYVGTLEGLFLNCYKRMSPYWTTSDGYEEHAIDQRWTDLQDDKWFVTKPELGEQSGSASTIEDKTVYKSWTRSVVGFIGRLF